MRNAYLRFGLVFGLVAVLWMTTGGWSCSASDDDPFYYIPLREGTVTYWDEFGDPAPGPWFDLYVNNNDSYILIF